MLNQDDHGNINWGHFALENGWPSTDVKARAKWVLAGRGVIPYGTFVIIKNTLYVSERQYLNKLEREYDVVEKAILEENSIPTLTETA